MEELAWFMFIVAIAWVMLLIYVRSKGRQRTEALDEGRPGHDGTESVGGGRDATQ